MIYFKDSKGEIFAYETEEEMLEFSKEELIVLTEEEVTTHTQPKVPTRQEISELRRLAYADPLTGSDPLYIEYQRSIAMNESVDQVDVAKDAWLQRAAAITAQYPWPEL